MNIAEQRQWIIPGEDGVAGVIGHTEDGVLDAIHQLAEEVDLPGEFRVVPEVVFIMILEGKHHLAALREGQTDFDASGGELDSFRDPEARSPLAAEDAAGGAAERMRMSHPYPADAA